MIPVFLILLSFSCKNRNNNQFEEYSYSPPQSDDDGIQTDSLSAKAIDEEKLLQLMNRINEGEFGDIQGILVFHDNALLIEEYDGGYNYRGWYRRNHSEKLHNVHSITKSITSLLIGIAIDKGYISGVDEKVASYFPEYSQFFNGKKEDITIEHLLTMTSGVEWDEVTYSYRNRQNVMTQFVYAPDPLKFFFKRPLASEPGTSFTYNGGNTDLLGEILKRATGMPIDEFAFTYLFDPLGIEKVGWNGYKDFLYSSGGCRLRERDLLKLGIMILNGGEWNGQSIVSSQWLEKSFKESYSFSFKEAYGYSWWLDKYPTKDNEIENAIYGIGFGGQKLCIYPQLDTVIVITAGNFDSSQFNPRLELELHKLLPQ